MNEHALIATVVTFVWFLTIFNISDDFRQFRYLFFLGPFLIGAVGALLFGIMWGLYKFYAAVLP